MQLKEIPAEFRQAQPVLEKIKQAGYEAYFVGGSVRDALLKRPIHDVDIATSAYPEEVKQMFPYTIDVGIEHGTVLVLAGKSESEHYEVTTFRTESKYTDYRRPDHVDFVRDLSEDLKRRDFTVNALAMTTEGELIDQFDGLADLDNQKLRAVGQASDRFNEDALRIMRAMRFAASLNFEIEPETFAAMRACAPLLEKISVERSFIEMDKLLMAPYWKKGLKALTESGAWHYLPDLEQSALEKMSRFEGEFSSSEQAWTALFVNYERPNVNKILRKWKASNAFIKQVSDLVAAYQLKNWDLESLYQYGLENAQLVDELKTKAGEKIDLSLAEKLDQSLQIHDKSELAASGQDLMESLGLKPGPVLGKLLKGIETKIVKNQLQNEKTEILNFARKAIKNED